MEVHAHAHTARKRWTHYLWEFIMLFLAVFCGFLAEYQLEHMIERDREESYVRSYIEDLKTDTAGINRSLKFFQQKMVRMDSLMQLLESGQLKGHENDLYFLARTLLRTSGFSSNDRTISQLKYSGSMRLIRNREAADSMMAYVKLTETETRHQEDEREERIVAGNIIAKIFDPFVFDKMVSLTSINRPANNPPLRSYDRDLQLDLAYCLHQLRGSNFIIQRRLLQLNLKATNLIELLEKKY